uniref:RNA replicase n=1 Tax=Betegovirus SF TaxID=1424630 RepID=V5NEZ4_9VIRU|nr:gp1 [Betegovirus SF]
MMPNYLFEAIFNRKVIMSTPNQVIDIAVHFYSRTISYPLPSKTTTLLALAATGLTMYATFTVAKHITDAVHEAWDSFRTYLIHTASRVHKPQEIVRRTFRETQFFHKHADVNHTHGPSAADRSSASEFATNFAYSLGVTPFFIQMSAADQRHSKRGNRTYFWSKDVHVKPSNEKPNPEDVRVLVDVDQYFDMPYLLANDPAVYLLYTFQPHKAASTCLDYSFTFDADGRVNYQVNGGGSFRHHVWNYAKDVFTVERTMFGVPISTTTYLIDRRLTSENHELILLTPTCTVDFPFAFLLSQLGSNPLLRLNPIVGNFIRLDVRGVELLTSTARISEYVCCTIPRVADDRVSEINRLTKHDLSPASVESAITPLPIEPEDTTYYREMAVVLCSFYRECTERKRDSVNPPNRDVLRVQHGRYDPEAPETMLPFMSPLLVGAYSFDKTSDNEKQTFVGRVVEPVNNKTTTPLMERCMNEFVDKMFPNKHLLVPADLDCVKEHQHKPGQIAKIIEATTNPTVIRYISSFLKSETYQKAGNPRNISTSDATDKVNYSMFTYPLAEYLKTFSWYAFGDTPHNTSLRLCAILGIVDFASFTDFSTFDGTIGQPSRTLEERILLNAYPSCYHAQLIGLHRGTYGKMSIGKFGNRVAALLGRGSGYPDTSIMNTINNAFTMYLAFRMTRGPDGNFLDADEAWARLCKYCLFAGDDGQSGNLRKEAIKKAADLMGFVVKVEEIQRGQRGVNFLARFYSPDVWFGSPNSMCDLKRQLSKFHTSLVLPPQITPAQKLKEKAMSYVLTDANTPIIGVFCKRAVELTQHAKATGYNIGQFNTTRFEDAESQYPNSNDSNWMEAELRIQLPEFDHDRFTNWINTVTTLDELMKPPLCHPELPPQNKLTVTIDGLIVDPTTGPTNQNTDAIIANHNKKAALEAKAARKNHASGRTAAFKARLNEKSPATAPPANTQQPVVNAVTNPHAPPEPRTTPPTSASGRPRRFSPVNNQRKTPVISLQPRAVTQSQPTNHPASGAIAPVLQPLHYLDGSDAHTSPPRPGFNSPLFVFLNFWCVIGEELFKRIPYVGLAFAPFEMALYISKIGKTYIPVRLMTLGMHFAALSLPLPLGIALHCFWNVSANHYDEIHDFVEFPVAARIAKILRKFSHPIVADSADCVRKFCLPWLGPPPPPTNTNNTQPPKIESLGSFASCLSRNKPQNPQTTNPEIEHVPQPLRFNSKNVLLLTRPELASLQETSSAFVLLLTRFAPMQTVQSYFQTPLHELLLTNSTVEARYQRMQTETHQCWCAQVTASSTALALSLAALLLTPRLEEEQLFSTQQLSELFLGVSNFVKSPPPYLPLECYVYELLETNSELISRTSILQATTATPLRTYHFPTLTKFVLLADDWTTLSQNFLALARRTLRLTCLIGSPLVGEPFKFPLMEDHLARALLTLSFMSIMKSPSPTVTTWHSSQLLRFPTTLSRQQLLTQFTPLPVESSPPVLRRLPVSSNELLRKRLRRTSEDPQQQRWSPSQSSYSSSSSSQ